MSKLYDLKKYVLTELKQNRHAIEKVLGVTEITSKKITSSIDPDIEFSLRGEKVQVESLGGMGIYYRQREAHFRMTVMPGQCVVWFSNVWVSEQGQGLGSLLHSIRVKVLKDMQESLFAMCTVGSYNKEEKAILIKNGWQLLR